MYNEVNVEQRTYCNVNIELYFFNYVLYCMLVFYLEILVFKPAA